MDQHAEALFAVSDALSRRSRRKRTRKWRATGFALKTRAYQGEHSQRVTRPNVIAILPGSDPQVAEQYVVQSRTWITSASRRPRTTSAGDDRIYNGVLDNAAGVATLLEVRA